MHAANAWGLEATCRCLKEDLAFSEAACHAHLENLADNLVIRTFLERRGQSPEGQETIEEIPNLRQHVLDSPTHIFEAVLGNCVRVRLVFENGDLGILTVAISGRLLPEGPSVPDGWYELLLAAFLPDTESLDMALDLIGQPLRPDEDAFCGLVARR